MLPSGHIFVFQGMLDFCSDNEGHLNEDKLAIIIGHEMAHAVLGHAAEKLSLTNLMDAILLVPMAVIWAFIPSDGIAFITHWFTKQVVDIFIELPFSRELEIEADTIGLEMAARACFDVRHAPAIWMVMEVLDEAVSTLSNCTTDNADILEEYKTLESFLSTHPAHGERQTKLETMMESAMAVRKDCSCPPLGPGPDPRALATQAREWWEQNREASIREQIEKKQIRQLKNKGIPLFFEQLEEETIALEIKE